jgi:hypothetical protein
MKYPQGRLTFDQLIALTIIQRCEECGYDHAVVRTCQEAREANTPYNETPEKGL